MAKWTYKKNPFDNLKKTKPDFFAPAIASPHNILFVQGEKIKNSILILNQILPNNSYGYYTLQTFYVYNGNNITAIKSWSFSDYTDAQSAFEKIKSKLSEGDSSNYSTTIKCPLCNAKIVSKMGKYGQFYGCTNWPECFAVLDKNFKPNKATEEKINNQKKTIQNSNQKKTDSLSKRLYQLEIE